MNANTIDLEQALLHTVDAEIKLMRSFNKQHLPVDIATTVAMRMSRAIVSSICRLGEKNPNTLTSATRVALKRSSDCLAELSTDYENRIRQQVEKDALLAIWKA